MAYLFSGLILCSDCGKRYMGKRDRNKTIYICQGYHNRSTDCQRFKIHEEELVKDVVKHLSIIGKRVEEGHSLDEYVKKIEVSGKRNEIIIRYMHDDRISVFNATRALF